MEAEGGSPEDSPSFLILINLTGFKWWVKKRERDKGTERRGRQRVREDSLRMHDAS